MRYLHTMVRISNPEASLNFFSEILGLKLISKKDYEAGKFTLYFLAAPEDEQNALNHKAPMIELTHNWEETGYSGGRNFGHLAYEVDDIYALCEKAQKMGVTILRPPRDGRMAFIKSPDGISIELLQKGGAVAPKEPWASMPSTGSW